MCTKGTPARVRLSCHCSHVMMGGGALVVALVAMFVWTHLLLLAGMAGLLAAGTFAAVRYLMRFTVPVRSAPVTVVAPVTAAPSPADVVAGFEEIARAAAPGDERVRP